MTNKDIVLEAFDLNTWINGNESGGIDPVPYILSVDFESDKSFDVHYTFPKTCGYSDTPYHVVNAGKEFIDKYEFDNNGIKRNGSYDVFGIREHDYFESTSNRINEFYNKHYGLDAFEAIEKMESEVQIDGFEIKNFSYVDRGRVCTAYGVQDVQDKSSRDLRKEEIYVNDRKLSEAEKSINYKMALIEGLSADISRERGFELS